MQVLVKPKGAGRADGYAPHKELFERLKPLNTSAQEALRLVKKPLSMGHTRWDKQLISGHLYEIKSGLGAVMEKFLPHCKDLATYICNRIDGVEKLLYKKPTGYVPPQYRDIDDIAVMVDTLLQKVRDTYPSDDHPIEMPFLEVAFVEQGNVEKANAEFNRFSYKSDYELPLEISSYYVQHDDKRKNYYAFSEVRLYVNGHLVKTVLSSDVEKVFGLEWKNVEDITEEDLWVGKEKEE